MSIATNTYILKAFLPGKTAFVPRDSSIRRSSLYLATLSLSRSIDGLKNLSISSRTLS